jgi:hypothetical protein
LIYVLPWLVYSVFTALEPVPPEIPSDDSQQQAQAASAQDATPVDTSAEENAAEENAAEEDSGDAPSGSWFGVEIRYEHYPLLYTLKILLTTAAVCFVAPGYRAHPWGLSPWSFVIGALGVVIWIGLCSLGLEGTIWEVLGFEGFGQRSSFNPMDQLGDRPIWAWGFLAIRFAGLVLVVPILEEFFLRGFVMRFMTAPDWWEVPFGSCSLMALVGTTLIFAGSHPAEMLAALVWFSAVSWLMLKTKNIWDCVAAHAVTNLLLGIYVVAFDQWHLM